MEKASRTFKGANSMATHLIVYGHGAGDPGGIGNGTNERDFNRKILHPHIKKWTDKSKHTFTFYDITGNKDLYRDTANGLGIYSMNSKQYASVTEIHEDASINTSATGGHVIIHKAFKPDSNDLALANVINRIVGWWGSVKPTKGISYRDNLLNLNVCRSRGINYRLLELGFITNKNDMDKIKANLDQYARGIVEAITGEKLVSEPAKPPSGFNIANYHTTKFVQVELIKDDYAYKQVSLKTKVGSIIKKGTILTVDKIEYSGPYPRFKVKSGLYITTRKDTIKEYKRASKSSPPPTDKRPRHTVDTYWYVKDSASYKSVIDYCKANNWNYKVVTGTDKRVKIQVGTFAQNSAYKDKLEKFLRDKHYNYEVRTF